MFNKYSRLTCAILILTPTTHVGAIQLLYVVVIVVVAATNRIPFVCRPALGHALIECIRVHHCSFWRGSGCCWRSWTKEHREYLKKLSEIFSVSLFTCCRRPAIRSTITSWAPGPTQVIIDIVGIFCHTFIVCLSSIVVVRPMRIIPWRLTVNEYQQPASRSNCNYSWKMYERRDVSKCKCECDAELTVSLVVGFIWIILTIRREI